MQRFRPHFLLLLSTLALLFAACTQDEATNPGTPDPEPPRTPELTANMWNAFTPEDDTICADGSEYEYYVYPGTQNKLVIDFQGGGACWDDGTCSQPIEEPDDGGVYNSRVFGEPAPQGIYDKTNDANPVGDWYHAYISYCTADIHVGNSVETYTNPDGTTRTVQHKGKVNAQAVLDWVFAEFEAPETIFVTGCSAGAYGSITYTPMIQKQYPDAAVYQMGDCGAGVTPPEFFEGDDGINRWNTQSVLAELIPELDLSGGLTPTFLTNVYKTVGTTYPESIVSQYNSAADFIQIFFYALQQGASFPPGQAELQQAAQDWTVGLGASLSAIDEGTDNFFAYTSELEDATFPEGFTAHCIITKPEFYTYEIAGVPFATWVENLVNGNTDALENVSPPIETAALN